LAQELHPMRHWPVLGGMRAAKGHDNAGRGVLTITLANGLDDLCGELKVGLSRTLDVHGGHEGLEPLDWLGMSQSRVDAHVGGIQPWRAEADTDPAGDTGHEGTKCRSGAAIENPYGLAAQAPQRRNQPQDVEPAFKLRAAIFIVERLCNAGFCL